jgi:dTDP-L-rhamnose 4-epimerase
MANVLVTGGGGFIGSFIADALLKEGHFVRVLDNLEPQVHLGKMPDYLSKNIEFVKGDVLNEDILKTSLKNIDVVFHEAAMVGVGQSMYQIKRYMNVNSIGTANLLDILANGKHNVKKLLIASSMSTYGEGAYRCGKCGIVEPSLRQESQMARAQWELQCPSCGKDLMPIPTPETKRQDCTSIYALSKMDQELMCMMIGKSYGIPTVAFRYFNVYGPRQSLSNPYTGVAAIFMSRIKNDHRPIVYEDGLQSRDFVNVKDIAQANILGMEKSSANNEVFNVGSGNQVTIRQVADILTKLYGKDIKPDVTKKFRKGDVRHCFADITKIKKKLGFKPSVPFEEGMKELIEWSREQEAIDTFDSATKELSKRGLV